MTAQKEEPARRSSKGVGGEGVQTIGSIGGSGNVGINLGTVVHGTYQEVINQQLVPESQFQDLSLKSYEPAEWVDPPVGYELVQLLADHRLLFVAGELPDKRDCARHIALLLRQRLGGTGTLSVRERYQGKDPQRIEPALAKDPPALLLLVDLAPEQLTVESPAKLRSLLADHQGYAIVTTDCSRAEWGIDEASLEARLWRELSWESYYGREALREYFLRKLDPCPEGVLLGSSGELMLVEGLAVDKVVETLQSPAQVGHFAQAILTLDDRSPQSVKSLLATSAGDSQAVLTWYRRFEPREQLLILGLTLLDGMPDEIVFAGLELLVSSIWRESDPLIPQFDYRDLPRISAYFKTVSSPGGAVKIECVKREIRERILDVLWHQQRRRLLASLPALAELLRWVDRPLISDEVPAAPASAARRDQPNPATKEASSEGDGKDEKRADHLSKSDHQLLQQALVDSLSMVARRSFEVVEPHFLELLGDPSDDLKVLAAKAVAGLREGGSRVLFQRLKMWWVIARDYDRSDPILERIARPYQEPRAELKAAIALVIGYSASYDRPNRLAQELATLLVELLRDPDRRVRSALISKTLPRIIGWHFRQLESLLRTWVLLSAEFIPSVASGAAEACRQRPEESLAILDGWRAAARADRRQASPLPREHLLATVALACGLISCDSTRPMLSPEAIGARLASMLAEENDPLVRRYVFQAIQLQAERNFELVALILQDLVTQVSLSDRPAAVEVFVRTYLAQRERLPGGDGRIAIGHQIFGIWTESARPLTEIEAALFSWVLDDRRPIGQQLAVDIFEALAETALERAETQLRKGRPRPPKAAERSLEVRPTGQRPQIHRLPILGRLAVYLAAPRRRAVRSLLRPLLAELIVIGRRRAAPRTQITSEILRPAVDDQPRARTDVLLKRWVGVTNEATRAVAGRLSRALAIYRWRWGIVAATILFLAAAFAGGRFLYQRWSESPGDVSPEVEDQASRQS